MPQVVVAILASCCKSIRVRCSSYIESLPRSDRNPRRKIDQSLPNREVPPRHLGRHPRLRLRNLPRRMWLSLNHPDSHRPYPPPRGTEPGYPPVLIVVRTSTHVTTRATYSGHTINSPPPPHPPPRTLPREEPILKSKQKIN